MATKKTGLSAQQKMFLKEFAALEKRIDDRIDFNAQLFKEYVDSRLGPMQAGMNEMREEIKKQGAKMDTYYNGIAKMVENLTGTVSEHKDELQNHKRRITVLESKIVH